MILAIRGVCLEGMVYVKLKHRPIWAYLAGLVVATVLLLGVFYWGAPNLIQSKLPLGVTANRTDWGSGSVTLHGVRIDKGWVKGNLDTVHIRIGINPLAFEFVPKAVEVAGGHLEVRPESRATGKGNPGEPSENLLKKLHLDSVEVVYKGYTVTILDVELVDKLFCSKNGTFHDVPKIGNVVYQDACFDPKGRGMQARSVMATLPVPQGVIPGFPEKLSLTASGVSANLKDRYVSAQNLVLGNMVTAKWAQAAFRRDTLFCDAQELKVNHPWLAPEGSRATFHKARVDIPVTPGPRLIQASSMSASVRIDLDNRKITGDAACQDWAEAIPDPRPGVLDPEAFSGHLSFSVEAKPSAVVSLKYNCQIECSALGLDRSVSYDAYRPDGETRFMRIIGPYASDWVPLDSLPNHVPMAVINLEDPSFPLHRGVLQQSLRAALERNLKTGNFNLGGSTLSQQLVKNLWLSRDRTFARKASEALLTMGLESCLSKDQILEWYLNVVEFGPNVYGVGPAAEYYFKHPAQELTPEEAYYLASILPHPNSVVPPRKGGLKQARRLMTALARNGRIPEDVAPSREPLDATGWLALE